MSLFTVSPSKSPLQVFTASEIKLPDESKQWDHFMIGHGGFANVYEIRIRTQSDQNEPTKPSFGYNKKAAIKKFRYDKSSTDKETRDIELTKLKREASIVNQISHNNIIKLFGVCYDDNYFGLILELCEGGSLGNVCRSIKKQATVSTRVLANWAHQISSAMKYLTDRKYIHRDLKADNVLVKELVCFCSESEVTPLDWCQYCERRPLNKLQLKITDFGLSKSKMSVGDSVVGTLVWLAPEVFQKSASQSNWSEFSDVWSFGVVLWEILAREMPHAGVYPIVVAHWNQDGQTLQLKKEWPHKWKEIMNQCWSLTPKHRPTFESLVEYFEEYTKGLVEIKSFENILKQSKWRVCQKRRIKEKKIILTALIAAILALSAFGYWNLQILKPTDTETTSICSKDYVYFNTTGFCYKTSVIPATQKLATANCQDEGATLASVHSNQENNFILNLYNSHLKNYRLNMNPLAERSQVWIGAEYNRWEEEWQWSDGTAFSFDNWKYREILSGRFFWTMLHPELNGKWGIADNKKEAAYVCKKSTREEERKQSASKQKKVVKECARGYSWIETTGKCYRVEFDRYTFNDATQTCAKENAHLTSIHSLEEHAAIVKFYKTKLAEQYDINAYIRRTYVWIGLTFDNSTESWNWSDGTSFNYSNWAPSYPLPSEFGYFWTILDIENDQPTKVIRDDYRNMGSANYFAFICQKGDASVPERDVEEVIEQKVTKNVKVDKTHKNCSFGFTYFEKTGYCYKSGIENLSFYAANRTCVEDEKAHLVSVHSEEENDFVVELAKQYFRPERIYIGLHYTGNEWIYTDGSEVEYTNWMQWEPNFIFYNLAHAESTVVIRVDVDGDRNFSKWDSQKGKLKYGYVCKKKAF